MSCGLSAVRQAFTLVHRRVQRVPHLVDNKLTIADKPRDAFVQMQCRGWYYAYKFVPPQLSYPTEFCYSRLNGIYERNRDPTTNFDPSRPPFRSYSVIGTDTDRSVTYDFPINILSNQRPILCLLFRK